MNKKIVASVLSVMSLAASYAGAQVTNPIQDQDIVQFDNLSIMSVSSQALPSEIIASYPFMMNAGDGSMGSGTAAPRCLKFQSQNSTTGSSVTCPNQMMVPAPRSSGAPSDSLGGVIANPPTMMGYRIEVSSATRLYMRDRSPASIADFFSGDQINVFGFYNSDGSIQAILVRNLSKPVERRFVQLNNVEVVSVSNQTAPADLVVVQRKNNPCYDYGTNGGVQKVFPCPMGVQSLQNRAETKDLAVPQSLMPIWIGLTKYIVKVDAQTVIMSRTRGQLSLADVKVGDKLNVYGSSTDNGSTIDADVIRDLSNPPMAMTFNGRIASVNADGSFMIQTDDGQMINVSNPMTVGARVQVIGMFDPLKNLISQISKFVLGGEVNYPALPMMKSGQ